MRRNTEVRVYLSSSDGRSVDWFVTRVEADGQVQWQDDGCYTPGRNTPMVTTLFGDAVARAVRRAASDALG